MILAVLNHLWQSTLCLLGAALLTLLLRRNGAHTRYWLWFAGSVKFIVPFTILATLGSQLASRSTMPALGLPVMMPLAFAAQEVTAPFAEIGAKLNIWSGAGTGTEIDLSMEGSIAYGKRAGRLHS